MVLFRVMRNGPISGTQLLAELEAQLRGRLPSTWTLALRREPSGRGSPRPDAVLELGAPTGDRARVVIELKDQPISRDEQARVVSVDWSKTIRRWAQDYSLLRSNRTSMWIEPRGLTPLLNRLRDAKFTYAVTGSLAAAARSPITAPRLAIVFVADATLA